MQKAAKVHKKDGVYYTPLSVAECMAGLFADNTEIKTILEPSCGEGVFIHAAENTGLLQGRKMCAVELDKQAAGVAASAAPESAEVLQMDFFQYWTSHQDKKFDLIIGNPPYIRHHHMGDAQQEAIQAAMSACGIHAGRSANIWTAFLAMSIHMLSEHGYLAFILPSELLYVGYAKELREYMEREMSEITIVLPSRLLFPGLEQSTLIFIVKRGGDKKGIRLIGPCGISDVKDKFHTEVFHMPFHAFENWSYLLAGNDGHAFFNRFLSDQKFRKFSDIADSEIGITTGNNHYFCVDRKTVEKYGLWDVAVPCVAKGRHIYGILFDMRDWQENIQDGADTFLLYFLEVPQECLPEKYMEYIKAGEQDGVCNGYKCRIRKQWYHVPSVWSPDAFMVRRFGNFPRLIWNRCEAVPTDSLNRVSFHPGISHAKAILSFYNSVSFAFVEMAGRRHGGGALEVLPSGMDHVMVPDIDYMSENTALHLLLEIDQMIHEGTDAEDIMDFGDREVLVRFLGIRKEECEKAREVWRRMWSARQRH